MEKYKFALRRLNIDSRRAPALQSSPQDVGNKCPRKSPAETGPFLFRAGMILSINIG